MREHNFKKSDEDKFLARIDRDNVRAAKRREDNTPRLKRDGGAEFAEEFGEDFDPGDREDWAGYFARMDSAERAAFEAELAAALEEYEAAFASDEEVPL